MAKKTRRSLLKLTPEQRDHLEKISQSRTAPLREVQRASILLLYHGGESITAIKKKARASRPTIYKCIDKLAETVDGLEL